MTRPTRLLDLRIEPVVRFEPAGMFDESRAPPSGADVLQALFRKAVTGTSLAQVRFVPGTELLLATRELMPILDDVAQVLSAGVTNVAEGELAGGYAFLDSGVYVFGVEDSSTLYDTARWDAALGALTAETDARVLYASDQYIAIKLENDMVTLTHERSKKQYSVRAGELRAQIESASDALREFARAFVPAYEKTLSVSLPPGIAREAAYSNFRNRAGWF